MRFSLSAFLIYVNMKYYTNLSTKDLFNEVWKDVNDYEGYYKVSNLGRVKSIDREVSHNMRPTQKKIGKVLKQEVINTGYLRVSLSKNCISKKHTVHKLVAMAFLNHTPCGYLKVIDHINNKRLDNRLCNIQVISQRENTSKDVKNKTSKYTGVFWNKKIKKWVSSIKINGQTKYLGCFVCEDNARESYVNELNKISENEKH
mgnify:CR=1 FL=1